MKSLLFTLLTVTLLAAASTGQAQTYFNERLPNTLNGSDFTYAIIPTDSGYVTSGETRLPNGLYGLTLRFLNPDGQQRRIKTFAGANYTFGAAHGSSLFRRSDGSYTMAGPIWLPSGETAMRLWNFDANGDTL